MSKPDPIHKFVSMVNSPDGSITMRGNQDYPVLVLRPNDEGMYEIMVLLRNNDFTFLREHTLGDAIELGVDLLDVLTAPLCTQGD